MKKLNKSFMDAVTYNVVYYWKDKYGDEYMAVNRWGTRVKIE